MRSRHADLLLAQEANPYMTLLALVAARVGIVLVPEQVIRLREDGVPRP